MFISRDGVQIELTREEMYTAHFIICEEQDRGDLEEIVFEAKENGAECLYGVDIDALVNNEAFMSDLRARWEKLNGHGGAHDINFLFALSEAGAAHNISALCAVAQQ